MKKQITKHTSLLVLAFGMAGAFFALLLGLLTFGVPATIAPEHLPLAIGASDASAAPAIAPLTARVAAQGGNLVDWRIVDSQDAAARLLDRDEIYGAVLFNPGPDGLTATVLVSGAVNPSATQVAQPILTQVATRVIASRGTPQPPKVVLMHPTSPAGRTLPLAASALLWLTTLVTTALVVMVAPRLRSGRPLGTLGWVGAAVSSAALGTGVVRGLAWIWDAALPIGWDVLGFLAVVGVAFAFLQLGVLRWLGMRGYPVLALLYLVSPAVAQLPPQLLNDVYRAALWSWTPFRFSAEALRSLLLVGPDTPDVHAALWIFGSIAVFGVLLLLVPKPHPGSRAMPTTVAPSDVAAASSSAA